MIQREATGVPVPTIDLMPPTVVPTVIANGSRLNRETSAFARGKHERALALLVDDKNLADHPDLDVILDLADHELLDVTTTTDSGFAQLTIEDVVDERADQILVHTRHRNGNTNLTGIWPASQWLRRADEHHHQQGGDSDAIARRFMLAGAGEGRFDAIVLDDIVSATATRAEHHTTPRAAAALVGLFLRSRHATDVKLPRWIDSVRSIGDQRFIVTRFALHEGWRWWSACSRSESTSSVGWAPLQRFERALRARDEVMIDVLTGGGGRALDREVLYHFDAMLVWLGSAFDGTAQIADLAHGLDGAPSGIGWLRSGWRKHLRTKASTLFEITEPGRPERAVLDLVAAFRNTIHGPPISGVTHRSGGKPERGMIRLPTAASERAAAACDRLGGRELWGYEGRLQEPEHALWDPYIVVQMTLSFAARALNAIMRATDVEALPGVDDPAQLMAGPPSDNDFFDPDFARRLLLLHGLGP